MNKKEVDRSVDGLARPNNFQIHSRLAVVGIDIDAARDDPTKVFHFADICLEFLIITEKISGGLSCFAITDRIQGKANDNTNKDKNHKSYRAQDANNDQDDFAVGH